MKRFKMGVLNNFQTHKIYSTNRKIIYRDIQEKKNQIQTNLNPELAEKTPKPNPEQKIILKPPSNFFENIKPPSNPFRNIPKINPFLIFRNKILVNKNGSIK